MFGFSKKKKPQTALDAFIFAVYGNPPPAKRADVEQAVGLADELLAGVVEQPGIRRHAITLDNGPIPYSTHDLALSVGLHFFKKPEYAPRLFDAQLLARMKALQWYQAGLAVPVLVKSFEDVLYKRYKPDH